MNPQHDEKLRHSLIRGVQLMFLRTGSQRSTSKSTLSMRLPAPGREFH